ncbi:MAG: ImmA/IrrE family metallo-endopeptidase [Nostoc sp. DedQUE05]|uniref:helix-turn-helix domain-containing protein n=1 Tax=Nostoc sp. DedQUE05 TaxID=3075391 RepID=UPI002AD28A8A|nr:ImmA/IrrE family metallo-endopeptidase [Nostoc sp. DedQUE05]MDZ8091604.1 ImmA/IrrE family metallo-endopeptidase [Nostoc sp. DedQUE05]
MNYAELGRRIRFAREEASLSQDVVAQHLELPRSAVSLIESGKRKVDSLELERFSRLVGKSILFFFDEESRAVEASNFEEDDPTQILFSANQVVDISPDKEQIDRFRQFHRNFGDLARKLNRLSEPYSSEPLYNVFKPTPAAAKWMAAQERARLGIPISSPIRDIWGILESEGVRVMAWNLVTPKLGGCFIFSPFLGSFVLVKRNLGDYSTNKLNFVLAHEYCHHLIHRQQKGITCDPSGHYRKPEEYFAQWFAANFLMPEEAIVPRLTTYLENSNGEITAEIVMHLALDFGVSYKAMLYRMADKKVELIEKSVYQQLSKEKPKQLLAKIGRSVPGLEKVNQFPDEYTEMVFEAYRLEQIGLGKLVELLEFSIEEAKSQLKARDIPLDLGVDSDSELLSDIENA